jgi:hypothetical protein
MFFAVDPWSADAISSLSKQVIKPPQDEPVYPILLIDGAFDVSFFEKAAWRDAKRTSLYKGTSLAESGSIGLWLIELDGDADKIEAILAPLNQSVGHKPMWSLLVSAVSVADLSKHLKSFLFARTADGIDWPVRWGDARVLPNLLAKLKEEERNHLMHPLHAWCHLNRRGMVQVHEGGGHAELPASTSWAIWELDDARFHALVDEGEADHIIGCIEDVRPDLLKSCSPSQVHQRVQACLKLADKGGISAAPQRQALAMLGLILDECFMQHPAFVKLLDNTRQGSNYEQELRALPEGFWSDCERRPSSAQLA